MREGLRAKERSKRNSLAVRENFFTCMHQRERERAAEDGDEVSFLFPKKCP